MSSHSGDDGTTYKVEVEYRYSVGGESYTSRRYSFMDIASNLRGGKEAAVQRYRPGSQAECFVNPRRPAEAVLNRGLTADALFGLLPLAFVAVGVGGIWFVLRMARRWQAALAGASPLAAGVAPGVLRAGTPAGVGSRAVPTSWPTSAPVLTHGVAASRPGPSSVPTQGRQELRPSSSPVGRLVGALCVALFWNGIVSVFLCHTIQEWNHGRGEWLPTLFLTPFVLIGFGLLTWFVYQLLALANPRPRLSVSSTAVPLGGRLEVRWGFRGRHERISRLRIWLEGREEATYRRGTNSHTDREVFARIDLADTAERNAIATGANSATLPADSMHSFTAGHNKIIWVLHVHGDIAGWPDVKEEFPFTVLPAPITPGAT
jgi:hypothetical protein